MSHTLISPLPLTRSYLMVLAYRRERSHARPTSVNGPGNIALGPLICSTQHTHFLSRHGSWHNAADHTYDVTAMEAVPRGLPGP